MNKTIVIASILVAMTCAAGCDDAKMKEAAQSAKDATKGAGDALGDLMAKGKDAVVKAANDHGIDLVKEIAEIKAKSATLTGDAKVKVDQGVKTLEADGVVLKEKLASLTAAGGDKWKDVAKEIEAIVMRMKSAIADLRARMK